MKGKKGDIEQLQSFIIYIIFALIVFIVLLAFVRSAASGDIIKEQVLAKQIALLVDSAKPNTELTIEKGNFTVTVYNDKVAVKAAGGMGYSYNFLAKHNLLTEEQKNKIIIRIIY